MATTYYHSVRPSFLASSVVWYVAGIIEAILGLRFILRLIGANPAAGFVDAVYTLSQPLVAPFDNIVRNSAVSGSVFDWNTLIAMVVYWLIATAIVRLFSIGQAPADDDVVTEVRRDREIVD